MGKQRNYRDIQIIKEEIKLSFVGMMVYFETVRKSVKKLCQAIREFKGSYMQNQYREISSSLSISISKCINQLEDKTSLGIAIKKYLQIQQDTHEGNFKTLLKNTEEDLNK